MTCNPSGTSPSTHVLPDSGQRIVMAGNGEISQAGQSEFWKVELDPWRTYVIEVLGADGVGDIMGAPNPGNLTLDDPHLFAVWDGDREEVLRSSNSRRPMRFKVDRADDFSGFHQFEVQSFGGNTGTYQIKIRVNNICVTGGGKAVYSYSGGPDGYLQGSDPPADTSTGGNGQLLRPRPADHVNRGFYGFLGDNHDWYWDQAPDEDWYGIESVSQGYEYTIDVETPGALPAKHQAAQLKILAVYDSNGMAVPGTSSAGAGKKVRVTFQPASTGMFYVSVGSGPSDRTGVYRISITERNLQESSNQRRGSEPREKPDGNGSSKKGGGSDEKNSPAAGAPVIEGTPKVGETLAADTSGIKDQNGMDNAAFTYRWMADGTDIEDADGETYTPAEDEEGLAVRVSVSFTDDAGYLEELTSPATDPVAAAQENTPATGAPTIDGTARVGETLTVDTSSVEDDQGLENATFTYQWIAGGSDIQDATGASYTLMEQEEGLEIQVRVSFQDDAGNPEVATSPPTEAVEAERPPNKPAAGQPAVTGIARVGEILAADTSGISDADGMDDASFTYRWMAGGTDIQGATGSSHTLTEHEEGLTIRVWVSFTDDAGNSEATTSPPTSPVAPEIVNTPATGQPVISGTPMDGETLTADISGIEDEDGMDNAAFTYQWMAGGVDIQGATGDSYTLTEGEVGTKISVWVAFTDDEGNPEAVTSAATEAVAPKPLLTAEFLDTPESHDGQNTFTFELRFSETLKPGFSYKTLRNHAIEVTGGTVTKAKRLEEGKNVRWEIHVQPDSDTGVTVTLPATNDCEDQGAICTEDGRMLSSRLEFTTAGPGG